MKRALALLVILSFASSAFAADERALRRELIREVLKVIDGRTLTATLFGVMLAGSDGVSPDRMLSRIDHAAYADEVYAPVLDQTFSDAELRQLITFFRTSAGQKVVPLFGELARSIVTNEDKLPSVAEEPPEPWMKAMTELQVLATAAEAYATDANRYPDASSYEALGLILSPTYIRELPEKDPWGTPYVYVVSLDGQHYRFASAGADRHFDAESYRIEEIPDDFAPRPTTNLDEDIIYQDATFVQYPSPSTPGGH